LLWVVTAFSVLAAGFPALQAYFLGSDSSAGVVVSTASMPVLLEVEGMTCPGCASTVESALGKVPGVEGSEVHYETGEAVVYTGDPAPTAAALVEAVQQAGYRARPKERN
jgi:copper chaperone CopZ